MVLCLGDGDAELSEVELRKASVSNVELRKASVSDVVSRVGGGTSRDVRSADDVVAGVSGEWLVYEVCERVEGVAPGASVFPALGSLVVSDVLE